MRGAFSGTRVVQVVLLAVAVASPWFGLPRLDTVLVANACLFGIAASGVNLMFGYGGMLSLGSGLFLGLGAYGVGIGTQHWHWPAGGSILAAVAASVVVAALLGSLLVRLSGHYFAVATLGLAAAFAGLLVVFPDLTGGASGLTTARRLDLGPLVVNTNLEWYVLLLVVTAVMLLLFDRLVAGKRGRILRLVRHDELAAAVLGVPVFRVKLAAFVAGGFYAGVAGSLLFLFQGLVVPDTVGIVPSVQLAALVVVGGLGLRLGGVIGAFAILWLQALLNGFGNFELVVYGAVFLAVMFLLPQGLEGAVLELWSRFGRRTGRRGAPALGPTAGPEPAAQADAPRAQAGRGLEVRGARRSFAGLVAVDGASLSVPAGTIVGLVGANGAGKSTLVNLISGVERLDSGVVELDGEDISRLAPADRTRRGIVRTFQVPRLVDELTVLENVVLGREASEASPFRRRPAVEASELSRARQTLAGLSLEHLADRPARSLGTGERKEVELARAVFSEASVVLLDEPAVGLALDEVERLGQWLRRMREQGMAVLVIDHNLDFVRSLADRIQVMEAGRIQDEVPEVAPERVEGKRASAASGKSLHVRDLSAGHGSMTVLHGVSFEVAEGEVLGVQGPNGAGKTTLLNALAGVNRRCSGEVLLAGTSLSGRSPDERVGQGLALVPEGRQVIGSLSVRANLDVTMMSRGRLRADPEHRARLEEVFDLFPALRELQRAPGSALSGGEQQMLAIARALMTRPSVLLLDEPSQGLAVKMVGVMVEALQRLKGSMTMVLVEQNVEVLNALSDRTLALSLGRVVGDRRQLSPTSANRG